MSMTGIGGSLMTGNSSCVGFFKMQNTAQGVHESRSLGRVLHFLWIRSGVAEGQPYSACSASLPSTWVTSSLSFSSRFRVTG